MRIHLVTVVGGPACVSVLPHMLKHYLGLGVDSVVLNVHATTHRDDTLEKVREIAQEFGVQIQSRVIGPWSQGINPMLYAVSRLSRPHDWWIMADHDEIQVYPDELTSIIAFCDRHEYDYVEGCFIDRVAEGGDLPPVVRETPLCRQYPIGCTISAALLGANPHKIVAARGTVRVGPGQHKALSGAGCPPLECFVPVHHFKWVAGVRENLTSRVSLWRQLGEPYCDESTRFLEYLAQHGVIDLANPAVCAAPCEPEYPHWKALLRRRLLAPSTGRRSFDGRTPAKLLPSS